MKITLENVDGIYSIETKEEYETIYDYYDFLIKPLLLSAGFAEKSIKECFEEES